MKPVRTRQIHLDFHTSEHAPDVGARFEKSQWQEALKLGRVNLINIFGKCHHSWSYYPTKAGMVHPTLKFDLLGAQIEACHEIDVKCPIYFTMGWSSNDAEMHPEWCIRERDGSVCAPGWDHGATEDTPKPGFQWKCLCPSGGYHELVLAQTEELCKGYEADGIWYDIYQAERLC
ncbi:MAG TPA: beta-galactosidase, partial [Armatimonadota bacterium]|nr:beta-galactosidase [Armatimonadota bacterium]